MLSSIAVVTPVYNAVNFINMHYSAIRNISSELEIVYVDDCSSDNTLITLLEISRVDDNVKVISMDTNQGPANARYKGCTSTIRDYISFIDIDDVPSEEKFLIQCKSMISNLSVWSYHGRVDTEGFIIDKEIKKESDLYCHRYIGLSSVMIHKSIKHYMKPFSNHRNGEDYICWFKINKDYGLPLYVKGISYIYYINPNGLSSNKLKQVVNVFKIYTNNSLSKVSLFKGLSYFFLYLSNSIFNKFFRIK